MMLDQPVGNWNGRDPLTQGYAVLIMVVMGVYSPSQQSVGRREPCDCCLSMGRVPRKGKGSVEW